MDNLISDTHQRFSAIISPFKFTQRHSSEACLFSSEKTCDMSVRSQYEVLLKSYSLKLKISVNQTLKNKDKIT